MNQVPAGDLYQQIVADMNGTDIRVIALLASRIENLLGDARLQPIAGQEHLVAAALAYAVDTANVNIARAAAEPGSRYEVEVLLPR